MQTLIYIVGLVISFVSFSVFAAEAEPSLLIKYDNQTKLFSRSQLLASPEMKTIRIENDPFYHRSMNYKAIPVALLFKDIKMANDATIQFVALDGFSAALPKDKLLNTSSNRAIGFIAIEPTEGTWPPLKPGSDNKTAGPFYLVWIHPEKSEIATPEDWPFQLSGFTIGESFASQFPHVIPASTIPANDPIMLGFKVFKTNCMTCHTMNREGTGTIGPDLNVPYNPTEYIQKDFLRKFIRNTQSVRSYPQDRMTPFPASVISDEELDHLITYLTYMADHKVDAKP